MDVTYRTPMARAATILRLGLMALLLATGPALASPAGAQSVAPACAAMDADLPPRLAGWTARSQVSSAATVGGLGKAQIVLGKAADVALHGAGKVAYPAPPQKPSEPTSYGGLLAFTIDAPGTYRVALSSGAWIDVLKDAQVAVGSTAHGHGPDCSTIHKMVDFPLPPGQYLLQISGGPRPQTAVLLTRAP